MAESSAAKEIERAISQALNRSGQAGTVILRDEFCELHTDAPVVAIELGDWVGQWNLLPDDVKAERVRKAAVRLINALNASQGRAAPLAAAEVKARFKRIATAVIAIFTLGLVVVWLHRAGFFGIDETAAAASSGPVATSPPPEDEAARAERIARVCDAARQRMYQGGSLGMDIDGWVVELWLARDAEGLATDPALVSLVAAGVVADVGAKGPTKLTVHADDTELGLATVVLRFDDGYVPPFFSTDGRERFLTLAERIADDVGALHAGLYARCAHLETARDVGAWYRGVDDNGAMLSLLYASGRYANPPAFNVAKYADDDLLSVLRKRVAALDVTARDAILRKRGGRPHQHDTDAGRHGVSLRFPLGGPTRAAQASRDIAGELDL